MIFEVPSNPKPLYDPMVLTLTTVLLSSLLTKYFEQANCEEIGESGKTALSRATQKQMIWNGYWRTFQQMEQEMMCQQ